MKILAVIPAKGESKGCPGKNTANLCGKPVICYTIDYAHESGVSYVVSTDSDKIAKICRDYGSPVVMRPAELAKDDTRIDYVLRHAVETVEGDGGRYDIIILLYACVPIREAGLIETALDRFEMGNDSVRSYARVDSNQHPDRQFRMIQHNGAYTPYQITHDNTYRRQDLDTPAKRVYYHDGGLVAMTRDALFGAKKSGNFSYLGEHRSAIIVKHPTVDIDSPMDLLLAETILCRGLMSY